MSDTNKHTGSGRLGVEPKIFTSESGTKIGKLFALLNDSYVDRAGKKHEETLPINLVLLRKDDVELAEKSLRTGSSISWEGKLARRTYEKDGKEQAVFEVVIAGPGSKLSLDAVAGERPKQTAAAASPAI